MSTFRFEAEIVRTEGVPAGVVRERAYGGVRVSAAWPEDLSTLELRLAIEVTGEVDARDVPAYVELFFHDVFLIMNLAAPGSFGGTISITGGELRVRELTFSPRVFEYAAPLATVPLAQVIAWYPLTTSQVATDAVSIALFELLHLARGEEDEEQSILRLARAAEALLGRHPSLQRLFALRDEIAKGRTPVIHPMHDDALDARVEDARRAWIEVADVAATALIGALQELARKHS